MLYILYYIYIYVFIFIYVYVYILNICNICIYVMLTLNYTTPSFMVFLS